MKRQTQGISEELLKSAKKEFLKKGFADASLRRIAAGANVSTSTIYTRFGDKLGLLHAIISPTLEQLKNYIYAANNEFSLSEISVQREARDEKSREGHHVLLDIIYDNFSVIKLLTIMPIEARRKELIDAFVDYGVNQTIRYAESIGSDAFKTGKMTPQLAHVLCTAFYEGIMEAVAHDMTREEAHEHLDKLSSFFSAGWSSVFS